MSDQFPPSDNDAEVTSTVTAALAAELGEDAVEEAEPTTGSEDFSHIPDAFGDVPYTYWLLGGFDAEEYDDAVATGTVGTRIPGNHSPHFAPDARLALTTGITAAVAVLRAYLAGAANP